MRAGHNPPASRGAVVRPQDVRSGLEVFFVDLAVSLALIENEEQVTPRLSAADRARAETVAGDSEQARLWRAARIATRIVLERIGGIGLRKVDFDIETGGRPRLGPGGSPHFNVSHSGKAVLIAVSKEFPVGVDIEEKRTLKMSGERRRRLVAAVGQHLSEASLSPESDEEVLTAWVRLEAAAKARGSGIGRLLTEQGVIGGARNEQQRDPIDGLQIRDVPIGDRYVAAIAAEWLPEIVSALGFPKANLGDFAAGAFD